MRIILAVALLVFTLFIPTKIPEEHFEIEYNDLVSRLEALQVNANSDSKEIELAKNGIKSYMTYHDMVKSEFGILELLKVMLIFSAMFNFIMSIESCFRKKRDANNSVERNSAMLRPSP